MDAARCWNCNAIIISGTICDDCKKAVEFMETYFEDGEKCEGCRFMNNEPDVNFSECIADDPYDCPALPDELQ